MKKKFLIIIYLLITISSFFTKQLIFKKKEKKGFKFKPLYLIRFKKKEKFDLSFDKWYFLIGENENNKIVAIDLSYKDQIMFVKLYYNGISVNNNKRFINRKNIVKQLLSSWYYIFLKNDQIQENDFFDLKNSYVNTLYNFIKNKYNVELILDIINRTDYIFKSTGDVTIKSIKFIVEKEIF
ncbi:MAG: hypothetical protein KAT05_12445 [Spirochaetes bacterium]|nr:hypothetical protein [Spirochaetota bacterium]